MEQLWFVSWMWKVTRQFNYSGTEEALNWRENQEIITTT